MGQLDLDPQVFGRLFNREPFGFTHNLSGNDLFDFDSLRALATKYGANKRDFYALSGARAASAHLFSIKSLAYAPPEALDRLDEGDCRLLMMRPENYDQRFRKLLNDLFEQVVELRGGLGGESVVRLESTILISSAATITPFHFDPEIGFFCHIAGEKEYHVYSPAVVSETDLEPFYSRTKVSSADLDLRGRDPGREYVFNLTAGKGHHQPQNAPHWVKTGEGRSVSYSFVFETTATRLASRVRGFNHYLRKVGLEPAPPGKHPSPDALKAATMGMVIPPLKVLAKIKSRAFCA
jgi:hypothetical protein